MPEPVATVTGAGPGIGWAIAHELAQNAFDVVANDLHPGILRNEDETSPPPPPA